VVCAAKAFDLCVYIASSLTVNDAGADIVDKDITLFAGTSLPWACRFKEYGAKADLLGAKSNVPTTITPTNDAKAKVSAVFGSMFGSMLGSWSCSDMCEQMFWSMFGSISPGFADQSC
jgi:hypothetical protein